MSTIASSTRTVSSIVAGRAATDAPGGRERSTNPARLDDVVADVLLGDASTLVAAAEAARAAQREWAAVPAPVRGRAIQQAGRLVEENKEALARLVTREIGKPYGESLGEVQEIVDTCNFFLGEGRRLYGQTVPSEMPDKQLFTFRTPVGVATIITAGNFPVAVPSWYLVPALLCGNAVVWKPAEYAPATAEALAQLFLHAGLPDGVLNLVLADGPQTFAGLEQALDRGLVDKVGFTGSSAVGARIGELCGRHLQSPCLELGGKNPLVVMADADLDLAAEGALFSGFGTAGQRCTSLGTVIVDERVHDDFMARFKAAVEAAAIGDPSRDVLYGPMIHERFLQRFERDWLGLIRDHHAIHGSTGTGRITAANPREGFVGDDPEQGLFVHPTIVDGVRVDDDLANTETFGPLVGVASFGDFDEAMALANNHGYGLSASIYTTNPKHAFRYRERISAGMVSVNNSTSGAEAHLPFGGNGKSGNGSRQSGMWVLDQFTRWQALNWDYAGKLQKAQMDVADISGDPDFRLED
jgi:alpha-ketoglutaric semialdehyde dehydrogenase